MGYLVNPFLVEGYIDDQIDRSVQGAIIGGGIYDAPQELELDRKLAWEREQRIQRRYRKQHLQDELDRLLTTIAVGKRRKVKAETIDRHRREALQIRLELEELKDVII